jgi:hypothetical protein
MGPYFNANIQSHFARQSIEEIVRKRVFESITNADIKPDNNDELLIDIDKKEQSPKK